MMNRKSYPEAFREWYARHGRKADTKEAREEFLALVTQLDQRTRKSPDLQKAR